MLEKSAKQLTLFDIDEYSSSSLHKKNQDRQATQNKPFRNINKHKLGKQPAICKINEYSSNPSEKKNQNKQTNERKKNNNKNLYQKTKIFIENKPEASQAPIKGRPPGVLNKHKSGSFYKRGVNKKGVEQWSFHYHYYDSEGKLKKTSTSVPFEKLNEARNIAHFRGTEATIKFLKLGKKGMSKTAF